jgi:hypothetical protein
MALAKSNNAETKGQSDHEHEGAALKPTRARDGSTGDGQPPARQSEGEHDYGRQGGSIADTGRRTDDPVGAEQVESSAVSGPDAERSRERQQSPESGPSTHR